MTLTSASSQEQPVPEVGLTPEQPVIVIPPRRARSFPRALISLRHRNFRLFWFGQMVSLVGTWMQTTGQAWLVLEITHSAWQLGIVGALQFLPILLFSIFGGVFADRWPKRNVLLFTQSAAMVQAVILWALAASGHVQIWEIYLLALLLGTTNSFDMPTRQSFVVEMVGREDLPNAVALNSSIFNLARILGPGMGGLVIAFSNVTTLFLLNALSFIAVIISLSMIHGRELHSVSRRTNERGGHVKTWQSLGEGMAYIKRTPSVLLIILVVGTVSLFGINFNVVLPLFADQVLNVGAIGYGLLSSTIGVGALLSALWIAWSNRQPGIKSMLFSTLTFSVLLALFSVSRIYQLSLALILCVGFAQIAFSALANTALQSITPDHLRGRVMSVYMAFFAGSTPVGNLLIGGLSILGGPSIAQLICAILALIAAMAGWIWHKPAEKDFAKAAHF
ncbi:MAG TPA: MFS transporter [Ktedonobacteraceae bacterium]